MNRSLFEIRDLGNQAEGWANTFNLLIVNFLSLGFLNETKEEANRYLIKLKETQIKMVFCGEEAYKY